MAAEYMHIGIPVTNLREGMTYNEGMKIWMSNPEEYDYKIEYLKFEEGTPFPEEMHHKTHIAYKVDDNKKYIQEADRVIFGPLEIGEGLSITFIVKDDTIIELYEDKN